MNRLILYLAILSPLLLSADPVTEALLKSEGVKTINYGYNKFIPSPYSKQVAVVPFDQEEGIARFERSKYKTSFFKLSPHYSPQQTITNCGIASAVIILNAVYSDNNRTPPLFLQGSFYEPSDNTIYGQFVWTEDNFFTPKIQEKLDKAVIEGRKQVSGCYILGITLNQLTDSLQLQGLQVTAHHATKSDQESISQFRAKVKEVTSHANQFMIAHYSLSLYLKDGGGHFSPVAAYDEVSDSVLILDTWSAANSWIWVSLPDLYKAMNTLDGNSYRGYLLIENKLP